MATDTFPHVWKPLLKDGRYPEHAEDIEKSDLNGPGVYLFIMRYPRTSVVYVGRAANLSYRIREHMANYLGFRYALRKDDPDPGRKGDNIYWLSKPQDEGFNQFNSLRKSIQKSASEVDRMRFYYWRCDAETVSDSDDLARHLAGLTTAEINRELEAMLIGYLRQIEADGPTEEYPIPVTCDNFRCERRKRSFELDQPGFRKWLMGEIANAPLQP